MNRKNLFRWLPLALFALIMLTGLRPIVLGGLQRGLLATGLWRAEVPTTPTAGRAAGTTSRAAALPNYFLPAHFLLDSLQPTPEGQLVRYGHELIAHTPRYLGPQAKDLRLRYAGNNLSCQNCHLQAGQKAYSSPYVGIWGIYPTYKGRENAISTLEDRINGCMVRSVNGRPLPLNGREMKAMVTYMRWLGRRVPVGEKVPGLRFVKLTAPNRAADLSQGKVLYTQQCASCHGAGGQGRRTGTNPNYQYPPLWGPDSYNDGAGMHRLLTAARFLKGNMPYGATAAHTILTDEAAYDLAGYINSLPRPHLAHLNKDYPDLSKKPVDCPYPPYADQFTQHQHQFGPYAAMRRTGGD